MKALAAGDNIASWCTKCRLVLDHAVVAMAGGTIAKVKCKTCGSVHKFRSEAENKPMRTAAPRKKADTSKVEMQWETSLAEAKGKEYAYNMSAKYKVGDIIDHNIFGKGVVMKTYQNKCDVLFKDKERLMASANS